MKVLLVVFLLTWSYQSQANSTAFNLEESKNRCVVNYQDSPRLYSGDLAWGMTPESIESKFQWVYESGKRIDHHSFYDSNTDQFYLYKETTKGVFPVKITENFIKSVTLQIETALENGFAEQVFFSDMGHSHLYFPQEHWDENYNDYPTPVTAESQVRLYEQMLADTKMRALYHLAEQLQMLDEEKNIINDPEILHRYWNRNFVGQNDSSKNFEIAVNLEGNFNTVSNLDAHQSYSAGFQVSASKDGCFAYKDQNGQVKYFDIGLKDLYPDPSLPVDDWGGM